MLWSNAHGWSTTTYLIGPQYTPLDSGNFRVGGEAGLFQSNLGNLKYACRLVCAHTRELMLLHVAGWQPWQAYKTQFWLVSRPWTFSTTSKHLTPRLTMIPSQIQVQMQANHSLVKWIGAHRLYQKFQIQRRIFPTVTFWFPRQKCPHSTRTISTKAFKIQGWFFIKQKQELLLKVVWFSWLVEVFSKVEKKFCFACCRQKSRPSLRLIRNPS